MKWDKELMILKFKLVNCRGKIATCLKWWLKRSSNSKILKQRSTIPYNPSPSTNNNRNLWFHNWRVFYKRAREVALHKRRQRHLWQHHQQVMQHQHGNSETLNLTSLSRLKYLSLRWHHDNTWVTMGLSKMLLVLHVVRKKKTTVNTTMKKMTTKIKFEI